MTSVLAEAVRNINSAVENMSNDVIYAADGEPDKFKVNKFAMHV